MRTRAGKSIHFEYQYQQRNVTYFDIILLLFYSSIRKLYGKDEACYVMDAKISGNLGRYFNVSFPK